MVAEGRITETSDRLTAAYLSGIGGRETQDNDEIRRELEANIALLKNTRGSETSKSNIDPLQVPEQPAGSETSESFIYPQQPGGVASVASTPIDSTPSTPNSRPTAIETPTPDQVVAALKPTSEIQNTQSTTSSVTSATTQTNPANTNNNINDIMSLLSYKLDNVISLLETGVTIQDRILLESRN
jgi:cell division septation protein DedD